jgi:PAS domain S-box-containing protein
VAIAEFLKTADLLPEAMILVASSGFVVAANRAAAGRLGLAASQVVGRRLDDLTTDSPDEIAAYLHACARTRDLIPATIRIATTDGSAVPCQAEGAVFDPRTSTDEARVLIRLVPKAADASHFIVLNERIEAQAREIRRRKQVEEELHEQREWFRVTLASIGDAVIATDTRGHVSYMNPVAQTLTGWPLDEARGLPLETIFRIINEDTRETVENPVHKALRDGVIVGLANHTVLIARDGTERSIEDTAAPIREHDGDLKGAVLVFHDIGERREFERRLRRKAERLLEADRRKNEFLAMLAHELRNPLAPTLNALRILQAADSHRDDLAWATELMDRQVRHMARLVDDLLDVSRITQGKVILKKERVDVGRLVGQTVAATRPFIESRRHQLHVNLPEEPIPLDADPARFEQILTNLLNNAAKYTEEGGQIWLESTRRGDEVVLRIRDNGVGIAPDLLPTVFDLFVQADRSLARSQGGLGIGLTLVRTLIDLHGGRIEVRSDGLGLGSEFTVWLPVATSPAPEPTLAPDPPTTPRAGRRRVLIVDDNVDSAQTLARLIKRIGCDVALAYDGLTAIEIARLSCPEIVILDIGLPGLDGYEVATRLRREHPHADLTIIAVSGYGRDEDRRLSREAGFDHHFVKPVDFDALIGLLRHNRS